MNAILSKPIRNHPEEPYLDWIKSGVKTYEGRLKCKIQEWTLYIGKKICFYDEDDTTDWVLVEVIDLPTFNNFGEAFDELGETLIPNRTKREVINMYNDLFHYKDEILYDGVTSKMINKKCVVAIGFKIIS